MKNNTVLRQCELEKIRDNKRTVILSWLPEKYAKVGKYLEIQEQNRWINGWEVKRVFSQRTYDEVNVAGQDYKKTRKASDV